MHEHLAASHRAISHAGGGHSHRGGLWDTVMHAMAWRAGSDAMHYLFRLAPALIVCCIVIAAVVWFVSRRRRS